MRLAVIGASRLGLRCLEAAAGLAGVHVCGVVTAPETFRISYRPTGVKNALHADLAAAAAVLGAPCAMLRGSMADEGLFEAVASWRPDFMLVAGWYHMVPASWRRLAPTAGLHASLLPDYSGGAPLVWAMINGEKRTGITMFLLDGGVDTGPIIGSAPEEIREDDDIASLYARIEDRAVELVRDHLPAIAAGRLDARPQDTSRRRVFPQRSPADGRIDWSMPARRVHDFIRAQTRPYPGAFFVAHGEEVRVWRSGLTDPPCPAGAPGTIVGLCGNGGLVVRCGEAGAVTLFEIGASSATAWRQAHPDLLAVGG